MRACIIFGSLVLGETQWGERGEARMAAQNHIWQFWRWLLLAFLDSLIPWISFGLLEGWPPGLGKGEISGEWRRQPKLTTGPFEPTWAQRPSDRVPGEVTQVLWLAPENWLVRFRCQQILGGSHQKGSMDSFSCRKTGPRTLGWRPSDTITLNTWACRG